MELYFVGVDVGTGSVRAALVNAKGKLIKQQVQPIKTWNDCDNHYEQSSSDIWQAVCMCVHSVTAEVSKDQVKGIGFAATCSLVRLGANGAPLSVSKTAQKERDVILWMDHRAESAQQYINLTQHPLLQHVGGQVSVEMQMPKLMWLKNHLSYSWAKTWQAFDLCDFLTWRCTNSLTRSLCSVVCKWNYDALKMQWSEDFLTKIGLQDLAENDFYKIGNTVQPPGVPLAQGLSVNAAQELHLNAGTAVSTGLIDAHAGALAMFGVRVQGLEVPLESKMAIIAGTSTCHMSLTKTPCWSPGVWGPYKSAIIPNFYLNEGGQSAAGYLIDYVIETHPYYPTLAEKFSADKSLLYKHINGILESMAQQRRLDDMCYLTQDLHIWPDFHGNRSPVADASLRGMICGLSMFKDEESLAILYLAFVQSLAYGTRHIIENLEKQERHQFELLLCCGGLAKHTVYLKSHADICALPLVVPQESEMVLIGAAMLGACASGIYKSLEQSAQEMGGQGVLLEPKASTRVYHERKYKVFKEMLQDQLKYRKIMKQ